jgi:hypothetical protein
MHEFGRVWREEADALGRLVRARGALRRPVAEAVSLRVRHAGDSSRPPTAPPDQPNPTELDFIPPHKTISVYDSLGRLARVTASDASVATIGYIGIGEVRRTTKIATEWGAPTPPPADARVPERRPLRQRA